MPCPTCSGPAVLDSPFCPDCGSPREEGLTLTRPGVLDRTPARPAADRSGLLPGTIIDDRYRLVSRLGRGGMGEVYRADDLKLGQPVALKFLSAAVSETPDRLARFLSEVRLARQVSHPGVCRVYDVGEFGGAHYLSMEFVDGEDLASLLRRIGHLPGDKALEVALQLCAGLGAAHEQGILHRDLKPANVMIDGRGRARIADFGLAALAGGAGASDVSSGTPLYMAPEQLAGREVSVRSDVYALGLVLYEMVSGRRPFDGESHDELLRARTQTRPPPPASASGNVDPALAAAILRCLAPEPRDRPASAQAVAAALPGSGPFAHLRAGGDTPSPEMVAAAAHESGLSARGALGAFAAVVIGIVAYAHVNEGAVYDRLPIVKSAEALRENARSISRDLGYETAPGDSAAWFELDYAEFLELSRERGPSRAWASLGEPDQLVLTFSYRQAPGSLAPRGLTGDVDRLDPAPGEGNLALVLDLQGRLRELRAVPAAVDSGEASDPVEWGRVFEAAGLEIGRFAPAESRVRPGVFAEERRAWTGALPGTWERPVRIEAAATGGRPVFFKAVVSSSPLWSPAVDGAEPADFAPFVASLVALVAIVAFLIAGALLLAVRNLRAGRGDRRGALRFAIAVAGLRLLDWLLTGHHVAGLEEIGLLVVALAGALSLGLLSFVIYIALEPHLRRVRPEALVSWSRLLAGRVHDPLVGRDILLGFAAWIGVTFALAGLYTVGASLGLAAPMPDASPLTPLLGGRYAVGELAHVALVSGQIAFLYAMSFLLCRVLTRSDKLAAVAFVAVLGTLAGVPFASLAPGHASAGLIGVAVLWGATVAGGILAIFLRFGLLALVAAMVLSGLLTAYPLTLDTAAPQFTAFLVGPLAAVVLAIWAFRASLAGRPILDERLLSGS